MSVSKAILLVVLSLVGSGSDSTIGGVLFADANQLNNNNDIAKNHHRHHLEIDLYTSSIPNKQPAPNNEGSISSPIMSTIQSPTLKTTSKGRRTTVGEDFWYPLSPSAPVQSEQRLDTPITEASSPGLSEEEDTVDNKIAKPFINWNAKPLVSTQGSNHPSKEEFIVNSTTPPESFVWNIIKPGEEEEDAEVSNVQVSLPVRSPQKEEEEWHFLPSPTPPAASIVVNDTPATSSSQEEEEEWHFFPSPTPPAASRIVDNDTPSPQEEEEERPFFSSPTPPAASIVNNDAPSDMVAAPFAKGGKTKTSKSKTSKSKSGKTKTKTSKTSTTSTSKASKKGKTASPTLQPSEFPSMHPSTSVSPSTSVNPSSQPSVFPSMYPSFLPTDTTSPSLAPSESPSISAIPSRLPSVQPSESIEPSYQPSLRPSLSGAPSFMVRSSIYAHIICTHVHGILTLSHVVIFLLL